MMFKRLFRKALPPAPKRPDVLAEAALDEGDPNARSQNLEDLLTLRRKVEQAQDSTARDLAVARYQQRLCGPLVDEAQALEGVACLEEQTALEQIALEAQAPRVRGAAIAKLPENSMILVRCALEDALPGHRQQAVERINDRHRLEQVLKQIGKKDTKVYRLTREKLRLLNEQEARPDRARARCDELCAQLERLGQHGNWIPDRARLTLLDQQYAELEADLDPPHRENYQTRRAAFIAGFEHHARAGAQAAANRKIRSASIAHMQTLVERLNTLQQAHDIESLATELARIADEWSDCDLAMQDAPADEIDEPALTALRAARQQALDRARARQRQLSDQDRQRERYQDLIAEAESLLATSGPIDHSAVRRLRRRLDPLQPGEGEAHSALELLEQLQRRVKKQQRQAERKLAAAPEQVQQLSDALSAGELRKAEPLFQKLTATLDQARAAGLPRAEVNRIDHDIKALQTHLRELQRWRRWSADQHRESLCHEAERLNEAGPDTDLATLAARLNQLRRDWRQVDQSGTPASEAYWQRFKQATDAVATRCEPFFQARAERQRANREARRTLCEQLEHFLAAVDWDSVDWKAMVRAEREMRQAWNALDPIETGGGLEGRFRRALARVDKALKEERHRNRAHKQHLIEAMQALAQQEDLDAAIATAKSLQKQWHTTVAGRQQEENALWRDFRTASDAVFSRRHQARAARQQEFQTHIDHAEALCAQAEALVGDQPPGQDRSDPDALTRAWDALVPQWRDGLLHPLPRQVKKALEQRWAQAQQQVENNIQAQRDQADWQALQRLTARADVLDHIAATLLDEQALPNPAAVSERWAALPPVTNPADATALEQAFAALLADLESGAPSAVLAKQCQANHAQRETLCLRLEILAHLDSPPEWLARRMAFQVERLQGKLRDGDASSSCEFQGLLRDWSLAAPATADPDLSARLQKVVAALKPAMPNTTAISGVFSDIESS